MHILNVVLSHDLPVIQWITSCHKNRMTTRVMSPTTSMPTMRFLLETLSIFNAINPILQDHYDQQNLTLVVISYEIYETRQRLVS